MSLSDLRTLPDWVVCLIAFAVVASIVLSFVVTVLFVHDWTRGPYHGPACGAAGVYRVVVDDGYPNVVCNNGNVVR